MKVRITIETEASYLAENPALGKEVIIREMSGSPNRHDNTPYIALRITIDEEIRKTLNYLGIV